jgi:hypothetical protein
MAAAGMSMGMGVPGGMFGGYGAAYQQQVKH